MQLFSIPLVVGTPQTLTVSMGGTFYQLTLEYRNDPSGGWVLDIDDTSGNAFVHGIPLVTGRDLLRQYRHLGFTTGLFVQTVNEPDAVPTFDNLGADGQLYLVTQ
jgi:hypothetical protein